MTEPMIASALQNEVIFTQDDIKRRAYDLAEKAERDRRGQLAYAKNEGISQGISQGIFQVVTEMVKMNLPYGIIAKASKLSLDEVRDIAKRNVD